MEAAKRADEDRRHLAALFLLATHNPDKAVKVISGEDKSIAPVDPLALFCTEDPYFRDADTAYIPLDIQEQIVRDRRAAGAPDL